MQVDDQILEVKFSKCEDDYDKPLYCPYFEKASIVIKNDNDKRFAERYFVEYCTSKNDPELPFYRKINMFKCEVTIKECLMYFFYHCKTNIDTLSVDYKTLYSVIKESEGKNDLPDNNIFSKSLQKHLR